MKKIITILIAITAITVSAQAQVQRNSTHRSQDSLQNNPGAQNEKRKNHRMQQAQMAEKLGLSNDQKQQMKSINKDLKSRMKELKSSNLSAEEFNAKKEALKQERKQKTMGLLTSGQKDKLKEFKKEQHNKRAMNSEKNGQMNS